jgi:hypothetical protein
MEALVLFLVLFVALWMAAEGGAILYRQYKQPPPKRCNKIFFDCIEDPKNCGKEE